MKKPVFILFALLFAFTFSCHNDDEIEEQPIPCQVFASQEAPCMGYGIPEPDHVPTYEERVYYYDCDEERNGFLAFCDLIEPLGQGEIYGIKRSPNGSIKYYTNDFQFE